MRKYAFYFFSCLVLFYLTSCKGVGGTQIDKQVGVTKACPTCQLKYVTGRSANFWMAVDTSKNPNIIYDVVFGSGMFVSFNDVDYMVKLN